eukprot:GFKZ01001147.1.p1 GENE.GFKZ01001147.1~~GFKZ01001147.1.p1  ORF type:complete len:158 (-),score=7.02 GFKZ01001147.1:92-565(-)
MRGVWGQGKVVPWRVWRFLRGYVCVGIPLDDTGIVQIVPHSDCCAVLESKMGAAGIRRLPSPYNPLDLPPDDTRQGLARYIALLHHLAAVRSSWSRRAELSFNASTHMFFHTSLPQVKAALSAAQASISAAKPPTSSHPTLPHPTHTLLAYHLMIGQ